MPRGRAAATPVNPHIQQWLKANDEVKKAMDKRKGENGLQGLQAARECFCKGMKIMTALLNDSSFPQEELDSWEKWCETDTLNHLSIWNRDATAAALLALVQAILEVGIKPHFLPSEKLASGEGLNKEEKVPDREGLERAIRAIRAIQPVILDGHNPHLHRSNPADLEILKASPYLSQQWLVTCINLLEYLDRRDYQNFAGVDSVATILQTLSGDDLYCHTKVWGDDAASNEMRVRIGRLIIDSKTTGMSLHGLRAIVYSVSGVDHGTTSREDVLSAVFNAHPRYQKASYDLRFRVSTGLASAGTEHIQKPRIYMYVINVLCFLRPRDKPRGVPVRSFYVAGKDSIVNVKSRQRLQKGEIIVYLDAFGIHVNVFDDLGYEDPTTMPFERVYDCRRMQDPTPNRLIWRMKPNKENPVDKEINLEVEEAYVDMFEQGLKHWLPVEAWLTQAGDGVPQHTSVLVPETSGASGGSIARIGQGTTSNGDSAIPNTVDESGTGQASHASDSHPSDVVPPQSSRPAEIQSNSRPTGSDEMTDKPQPINGGPPRRRSRGKADSNSLESEAPVTEKMEPQPAPIAKAKGKGKGKGRGKQSDGSTGTSSASPEKSTQPAKATGSSLSPVRPSRTAKSRAMARTTEVLDEEAVPLNEIITVSPKKQAERKFGEGLETQGGTAVVSTQSIREMAVVEEVVEGVDDPAEEDDSSVKARPKSKSGSPTKKPVGRGKGKGKAPIEASSNGDNQDQTTESLPATVELEESLSGPAPPTKRTTRPRLGMRLMVARTDRLVYKEGEAEPSKVTGSEEPIEETFKDAPGDIGEDDSHDGVQEDVFTESQGKKKVGKKPSEVIAPDPPAPIASQQVPITKPNAISRSGKKSDISDSREKPTSKRHSASSDSEADDEPGTDYSPNKNSESKDPSLEAETLPKPKPSARPSRPKIVLQPKQPKETLAGQIKIGQAMTPAKAVEAKAESSRKIAAEKKAEEKKKTAEKKAEEKRLADLKKGEEKKLAEKKKKEEQERAEKDTEEAIVAEEEERAKEEEERKKAETKKAAEKKKVEKKEADERKKAEKRAAEEEKLKEAEEERGRVEAEKQADREERKRRDQAKRLEKEKRLVEEERVRAAADAKATETGREDQEAESADTAATTDKLTENNVKGKTGPPKAKAIKRSLTAPNPIAGTNANSEDDEASHSHPDDQVLVRATQDVELGMEDAFGIMSEKVSDSDGLSDEGDGGAGLLLEEMVPPKKKGRQANTRPQRSGSSTGVKSNTKAETSAHSVEIRQVSRISAPTHVDTKGETTVTAPQTEPSTAAKRNSRKKDAVIEPEDVDEDEEDNDEDASVDQKGPEVTTKGKGKGKVPKANEEDQGPSKSRNTIDREATQPSSKQAGIHDLHATHSPLKSALKQTSPLKPAEAPLVAASGASANVSSVKRPVIPLHRSKTTGNIPRVVAFSDPIEAGRTDDIQLAVNVPIHQNPAPGPTSAVAPVPVVAILAPVSVNVEASRRDKRTAEAARLDDIAVEPPAKRMSPARNLVFEDSLDPVRAPSELPLRPRRPTTRNPQESPKPAEKIDTVYTKQDRVENREAATYEVLSSRRKRKVSINEPVVGLKARKVGSTSIRGGQRHKAREQMEEGIYSTIDEIAQVVKDRVRDRLERPKKTAAAIKQHVSKVACKLVDGFGIDHDAIYQDLNKQAMAINHQQKELQKLAKQQVEASKIHTREIREIIKLYKNPMEGIPTMLFS